MAATDGRLKPADVRRRFDTAAATFDQADFVHRRTFDGLVERLAPVTLRPKTIIDLGSATGSGSRALAKQYRQARVVSLDVSLGMLRKAKQRKSFFSKGSEIQADATQIPLKSGSADLVFANLVLPWLSDLPAGLAEVGRVLHKDGVFAFSTLGPDSFCELRDAWLSQDQDWHVNPWADMHDIGDAMVRAGLRDPVLDVDRTQITYRDFTSLCSDLTRCGARNSLQFRHRALTGKARFRRMQKQLAANADDQRIAVTLELIYGHAWGSGAAASPGEFLLPADSIGRRQR